LTKTDDNIILITLTRGATSWAT